MTVKKKKKKWLLTLTALVLTGALGAGIWFAAQGSGEPVNVYPFQYIGMTEFWGDNQESYGPVTTDKIQTVFLSDTQTVTEVAVKDGDTVKKGDLLFTFDTTLDGLSLERKRLEVEKVKLQIRLAGERLEETYEMTPYNPPAIKEEEPDLGEELKDKLYQISENEVYDGSKQETSLICWLKEGTVINDAILRDLYETALEYQTENAKKPKPEEEKKEESSASALPGSENLNQDLIIPDEENGIVPVKYHYTGKVTDYEEEEVSLLEKAYDIEDAISYKGKETYWLVSAVRISDGMVLEGDALQIPVYPSENTEEQDKWRADWKQGVKLVYTRDVTFKGSIIQDNQAIPIDSEMPIQLQVGQEAFLVITSEIHNLGKEAKLEYSISPENEIFKTASDGENLFLTGTPETVTSEPVEYQVEAYYTFDSKHENRAVKENYTFSISVVPYVQKNEFYVVFKVTEKNYEKGNYLTWQGAKVTVYEDGTFGLTHFDAAGVTDHMLPPPEDLEIELPTIDPNAIYTGEQILQMQKDLNKTIKEQKEKLKMVETEYLIMERELGDGNVYAEIDGKVVSLLTEGEARQQNQPLIKVSGGGGFYVEGSVSELEKDNLKPGQEVTINDWNTGNVYTGEVVSIGDFPSDNDNWNGMGNPTASYYPFLAFVDESADLQAGNYVSMSYSTASAEQGIYLEKAFVRSEKGEHWIYVRGADGKLEKRSVRVGKVLWGSYYEILSPLGEEDFLAFPYGKQVKDGAPTVESDLSTLYSY